MWNDLRFALRTLARRPALAAGALLTLALGIGVTCVVFSVADAVLLRPLPYRDPARLVRLFETRGVSASGAAFASYLEWKRRSDVFDRVAVLLRTSFIRTGGEFPERLSGAHASADLFPMLGVEPVLGRGFLPGDEDVAIVSHAFWRTHLGGDPAALGKSLTLDGRLYTIAGVLPASFRFRYPEGIDVWTPLALESGTRRMSGLWVLARLKDGVALQRAREAMKAMADPGWTIAVVPPDEQVTGKSRPAVLALTAAVAFVLLIACANVANLLLARAAEREREMSIRAAVGAGRWRLVRQLLTESVLISAAGGALGLAIAACALDSIRALAPAATPRVDEIGLDWRVLAFAVALACVTGLAFGIAPALQLSRTNLSGSLKRTGAKLGGGLVVCEVALGLTLLAGAGLMINSFGRLLKVELGFRPERVLRMEIQIPRAQHSFFEQALERIRAVPGVESAGFSQTNPIGDVVHRRIRIGASQDTIELAYNAVAGDYFGTMRIALRDGRYFSDADSAAAPKVALVNQSLVRRIPIGETFNVDIGRGQWAAFRVIGVVADVRHQGRRMEVEPELYVPHAQEPRDWGEFVVRARSGGDPLALVPAIRAAVRDAPIDAIQTMGQAVSDALAEPRFLTILLGVFAAIALALTATGVYGVIACSVRQRTREIGIRIALGASRGDVLRSVVGHGGLLAAIGIAIGCAGAVALGRLVSGFLYGVTSTDPTTLGLAALAIGGVAVGASYIPARRAARVDPAASLRSL